MTNIDCLYSIIKDFIVNLSKKSCLSAFYIGKSEDVDTREYQHCAEGFERTIEIAHSFSADKINEAEKYLISLFEEEKELPVTFDNKRGGGGGNPKANKLYVALHFKPKNVDELYDDDLKFDSIEL